MANWRCESFPLCLAIAQHLQNADYAMQSRHEYYNYFLKCFWLKHQQRVQKQQDIISLQLELLGRSVCPSTAIPALFCKLSSQDHGYIGSLHHLPMSLRHRCLATSLWEQEEYFKRGHGATWVDSWALYLFETARSVLLTVKTSSKCSKLASKLEPTTCYLICRK